MNPLRRISSLNEDFQKLGISVTEKKPAQTNVVTESTTAPTGEKLGEARLVRVKTKRMKGAAKSKARVQARKTKSKRKRKLKLKKKKASFKRRIAKIKTLKKGRKAGAHKRFRLVTGIEKQATMFESLQTLQFDPKGNLKEELVRAFRNVIGLAGTLVRKFAVVEEVMDDLEAKATQDVEIEHPDSEHKPDAEVTNASDTGKTGDAVDTAADVKPGNVKAEEDGDLEGWDDEEVVDGEDGECDDDMDDDMDDDEVDESESSDDESDDEEGEEGDEGEEVAEADETTPPADKKDDEDEVAEDGDVVDTGEEDEDGEDDDMDESIVIDMAQVRMEAEDVLQKLKMNVLTPEAAASVLQDMVSYLGGAMKVYLELASDIAKYAYAGTDQPNAEQAPEIDTSSKAYAGKDQPAEVGVGVTATGDNRYVGQDQPGDAGTDPSTNGTKQYAGQDAPADAGVSPEDKGTDRRVVGKDQPSDA